jgi:hypothetical protein
MSNKVIELLKVYLNTKGDFRSPRSVPFMDRGAIFFSTKVFLDPKILKGNNIDIKQVFINYEVFFNAVRVLKSVDYAVYTPEQIKTNNIEVFRKTFLKDKTVIPIGSKKMVIIKSTLVANSFKPYTNRDATNRNTVKRALTYEVKFDVVILDALRNLQDADFSRANCKLKAADLNKQAREIFNFDLGLDDEFSPMKRSISKPPSANSPYGSSSYSSYSPYSPYGSSYSSSYNSPYGSSYGSRSPYGSSYSSSSNKNNELSKTRREISLLLKDLDKEEEKKLKERYTAEWLNYRDQRQNEGLLVVPMTEWIADRELKQYEYRYKNEWLKYKQQQEAAGKKPTVERWRKDKMEEDSVNESDFFSKKWLEYKSDQAVLGKTPVMLDWLKSEVKKYKKRQPLEEEYAMGFGPDFGGKKRKGKKSKRSRTKRKSKKGGTKKKRSNR